MVEFGGTPRGTHFGDHAKNDTVPFVGDENPSASVSDVLEEVSAQQRTHIVPTLPGSPNSSGSESSSVRWRSDSFQA